MDTDLYDEFGNYTGPDLESDDEEEEENDSIPSPTEQNMEEVDDEADEGTSLIYHFNCMCTFSSIKKSKLI